MLNPSCLTLTMPFFLPGRKLWFQAGKICTSTSICHRLSRVKVLLLWHPGYLICKRSCSEGWGIGADTVQRRSIRVSRFALPQEARTWPFPQNNPLSKWLSWNWGSFQILRNSSLSRIPSMGSVNSLPLLHLDPYILEQLETGCSTWHINKALVKKILEIETTIRCVTCKTEFFFLIANWDIWYWQYQIVGRMTVIYFYLFFLRLKIQIRYCWSHSFPITWRRK